MFLWKHSMTALPVDISIGTPNMITLPKYIESCMSHIHGSIWHKSAWKRYWYGHCLYTGHLGLCLCVTTSSSDQATPTSLYQSPNMVRHTLTFFLDCLISPTWDLWWTRLGEILRMHHHWLVTSKNRGLHLSLPILCSLIHHRVIM